MQHVIVLEDSSLELVPNEILHHRSCKNVEKRLGIPANRQILDDNFHGSAMTGFKEREKRGRPDVVHFALLDITSTPLYSMGKVSVIVHTIDDFTISVKKSVRLPRTLQRFNGVFSKILSGELSGNEENLFSCQKNQSFTSLISELEPDKVVGFSTAGALQPLEYAMHSTIECYDTSKVVWIVGGFPFGHFGPDVLNTIDSLVSISEMPLAAHVVTSRLCYELEKAMLKTS